MDKVEVTIAEPCMVAGKHKAVGEFVLVDKDEAKYLATIGRVKIGKHKIGGAKETAKG